MKNSIDYVFEFIQMLSKTNVRGKFMLPDTLGILNPQMTFSYINDLCSGF